MEPAGTHLDPALERAVALLVERFRPAAILLYGSQARGRAGPLSDVDLALLSGSATEPDAMELARARTDLEALLGRDVDLVVLDTASPVLAMQVLRQGRLLYERDPAALAAFAVRALGEYFDLKQTRRPIEERLLAS